MSLPSDLELTKLRLWFHRAESRQHELEEDAYQARRDFEELWLRYVDRCKKLGFCAACEKPLPECRCVLVGAYLNEKPHEPLAACSNCDTPAECAAERKCQRASPPHAAAEPEKPVAWIHPDALIPGNYHGPISPVVTYEQRDWIPLYAAVQQPIARDALIAWIEENIYGWMDMQPESHGHDHDAIACDVAEFLKSAEGEK